MNTRWRVPPVLAPSAIVGEGSSVNESLEQLLSDNLQASHKITELVTSIERLAKNDASRAFATANRWLCHRTAVAVANGRPRTGVKGLAPPSRPFSAAVIWANDVADAPISAQLVKENNEIRIRGILALADIGTVTFAGRALAAGPIPWATFISSSDTGSFHDRRVIKTIGLSSVPICEIDWTGDALACEWFGMQLNNTQLDRIATERALMHTALLIGTAGAMFDYSLRYAHSRVTFGKRIIQHQAIALKIADLHLAIEAGRLLLADAVKSISTDCALTAARGAWRYARKIGLETAVDTVQVLGAHGLNCERPVEKWFRDLQTIRFLCDEPYGFGN